MSDYFEAQHTASQGRAEYFNQVVQRWKARSTRQKAIDIGAATALVVTGTMMVLPDMHQQLEAWNPDYHAFCYTHDEKAEGLDSEIAYDYMQDFYDATAASYPYGQYVIAESEERLTKKVVCVGPTEEGDEPVTRWLLSGVTVIDENYSPVQHAFQSVSDELHDFWSDSVDDMEPRLVYGDGLLFSRFERGVEAVNFVDQAFRIAYETSVFGAFETAEWQKLRNDSFYGQTAIAYEDAVRARQAELGLDKIVGPQYGNREPILNASLRAFLNDPKALNRGDIDFMRAYYPHLEDSEEVCTGSGEDRSCHYEDTAPPSYIHSRRVITEHLIALSALGQESRDEAWLDLGLAQEMIRERYRLELHSDEARNYEERIKRRISWWRTERHDTGRPITENYLIQMGSANGYYNNAENQETYTRSMRRDYRFER